MKYDDLTIGILALQGDFEAHQKALELMGGVKTRNVRLPVDLVGIDGLLLPGGESTTIGKLLKNSGLDEAIREKAGNGLPIFGTCAGLILLAKRIENSHQPTLGLMDITVERNAFGRQLNSFEADIDAPSVADSPLRGVFIRAPYVTELGTEVSSLASYQGKVVAVQQRNILGAAFHPELTGDRRFHEYFLKMAAREKTGQG